MLRRLLLVVTLIASVQLLGQNGTSGSTSTAVPVPGLGYVINGGYVTTAGNGQLVTPQAAFGSPAPTAGISNGDRAGISNNGPTQSNLEPSPPQTIGVVEVPPTIQVPGPIGTNTEETSNSNATSEESRGPANDLGPSYFLPGEPGALSPEASLGEVAEQYRAKHNPNAHVYTNADIAQLRSQSTGIVLESKLAPPPGQQTAATTTQPQRQAPAATIAQAQPPAPRPQQPGPSASQSNQPQQQPQGNSGTMPQINQPSGNGSSQDNKRLPATSTILPLLGLLGLASGGLGLWFRSRRRG